MVSFVENVIIGAGLTGLSAACHLKGDYILLEQNLVPGGMASSDNIEGFVFDRAGHLLHFQEEYVKKLLDSIESGSALIRHKRFSWILSNNVYTRYPFQVNTYKLPPRIIKDCLVEMVKAKSFSKNKNSIDNLRDWILQNFGEGIARHFMFPYNRKLWQIPLHNIAIDWVDKFIPKARLESAIRGAVSDFKKGFGYNRIFYYPDRGGIQTVSDALLSQVQDKVLFGKKVIHICLGSKIITLSGNKKIRFNRIISTMPLPELIKIIKNKPGDIKDKVNGLKYVSVFNLNLGIDRNRISDKHWIYFPERKYIFYRVGFFSNFAESVSPDNKSSLYAEVSYTADKPLRYGCDDLTKKIIADLNKAGILKAKDRILAEKRHYIKYAYPVSSKNSPLETIDKFLKSNGVYSVGRYGSWKYMSMEDCIIHGKITAERVNDF